MIESLAIPRMREIALGDGLIEVTKGVGPNWREFRVIGATRSGLAPAKEQVGKQPERYKLVEPGMIFYNPMRILLGSIAMVDEEDEPGITSPDYVVVRPRVGILHPLWFYTWFRSPFGEAFIRQMTRGAVRERLLFRRLAQGTIRIPNWELQLADAAQLRLVESARRSLLVQLDLLHQLPNSILKRTFSGNQVDG